MNRLSQRALTAVWLAVAMGGCNYRLSDAQTRIAASMRNPAAVRFRDVNIVGATICGEIDTGDAPAAGGGFRPFLARENDFSVIYPVFPPDARATTVAALRTRLAIDRAGCASAISLRQEVGLSGDVPQCTAIEDDKRAYIALKVYAARYRQCSGHALSSPASPQPSR